ncbi:MAG: hypothetical protein FJX77_05100, partial [Armatimonadetes bacterium]|nr:hypothetical protein [Armatimonadota bacterium]
MAKVDPITNLLVATYPAALLHLAGIFPPGPVRAVHPRLSQTTRTPDGLVEWDPVPEGGLPSRYLMEVASVGESRVLNQMFEDLILARLCLHKVPPALLYILEPHSQAALEPSRVEESEDGRTGIAVWWEVVKVYERNAEAILALEEAGLTPLLFAAQTTLPPAELAQRAATLVAAQTHGPARTDLLAACQVMAERRYNDPELFRILGGREMVAESRIIQEIVEEKTRE